MDTPIPLVAPPAVAPRTRVRRAVFFDVENSSRPEHVERMVEHLELASAGRETQLVAIGNFRVVGQDTARMLARCGARLVHSAPMAGVKDWSDLRIAAEAGIWLASSTAGDVVEIVTDDQAFDAVGDVAANRGVVFRRLSYRRMAGSAPVARRPRAPRSRR
jgi:hypothetical protein